ncbi:CMRF35-like molecule 2 isoform X2 [Macrotis lagotis]|uniref:CMRF35-like molecule 2 isoform X2 n=1 Tax=Macrotis lagotis TaxID=92651 RepID=UPI003D685F52
MRTQERLPLLLLLPLHFILLFLCPKDCLSLTGPKEVKGIVEKSLIVQCSYEEKYKTKKKYWCKMKDTFIFVYKNCEKIMETQESRVSIRDHSENLTFTVTMKNLTEADEGKYQCGIDLPNSLDETFSITIFISPASSEAPNIYVTTSPTDMPVTDINEIGGKVTSKEISDTIFTPRSGILEKPGVLLLILGLLIISLVGALFLAWRMMRQKKAGEKSMVFPEPNQPNIELYYENLELQERHSNQDSLIQSNAGVEYGNLIGAHELSITYSILTFPKDNQKKTLETQEYLEEKVEYSTVRKT